MFRSNLLRSLITGLGIAVIATACTPENVSGPQSALTTPNAAAAVATSSTTVSPTKASGDLLGGVLQLTGGVVQVVETTVSNLLYPVVQRQVALAHSITVTKVIPASGGTIAIPAAGMSITFSPGALLSATAITVTADSGKAISYEFGPHGIQFNAPVTIQQDMSLTTLANTPSAASGIHGGYTPDGLGDVVGGLLARIAELLNATTSIVIGSDGKAHLGTTKFIIKHFSGYILISA